MRRRRAAKAEPQKSPSLHRKTSHRETSGRAWAPRVGLDLAAFGLILVLTFIAYLPAVNGTMLWDDENHITRPALQSLHGLWRIWFEPGATYQYYPLLYGAFWLEHQLWGDATTGYHILNIVLHVSSAWLVVLIVRRLEIPGAWLAGAVVVS